MSQISNYTFEEITIGQTARYSRLIGEKEVLLFAAASGDVNPVHLDAEFAAGTMFKERIAHGMISGAIISSAIALALPGPGSIYLSQSLRFRLPVKIGDELTAQLEVTSKRDDRKFVTMNCVVINQHGKTVTTGIAEVLPPAQKLIIDLPPLPRAQVQA